jgi:RNA recognition motif-containing protein
MKAETDKSRICGSIWKGSKMNIYVGNLSRETTDDELRQAFEAFGQVASINIIRDKFSGESRGFGFVEMPAKAEADAAIQGMNGQELKGNTLNVNEARPREDKPRGGGGGGGRGGRGGRGGGGRSGGGRGGSREGRGGGGGYGGGGGRRF